MTVPLFKVTNSHSPESVDPPIVSGYDPDRYTANFEGPSGDQLVFTFDRRTRKAELRSGDVGWNNPITVIDGSPVGFEMWFSAAERVWLAAAWMAATDDDLIPAGARPAVLMSAGAFPSGSRF